MSFVRALPARALSRTVPQRSLHTLRRPVLTQYTMAARAASTAAGQVKAGDAFPAVPVKITDPKTKIDFSTLKGKNVVVTVPGAFTGTCHSQVEGYLDLYDKIKAKGVDEVYVVAVNDIFVVNAWKKDLSGSKDAVKFTADDRVQLAEALGIVLDMTPILGGPRLKRGAIVIENGKVVDAFIEPDSSKFTVASAESVLKSL